MTLDVNYTFFTLNYVLYLTILMLVKIFNSYTFITPFEFQFQLQKKYECIYSIVKLGKFWQIHVGSSAVRKKKQHCCSKVIYNVRL